MGRSVNRRYQIRVIRKDGSSFVDKFDSKRDALEMVAAINWRAQRSGTGLRARLEGAI